MSPSSESLPCSTSCMAQAPVTALVIEAIQTTVSAVIGTPVARSRTPNPASKITPSAVAAAATTPGLTPAVTAARSGAARAAVSVMISSGFCWCLWRQPMRRRRIGEDGRRGADDRRGDQGFLPVGAFSVMLMRRVSRLVPSWRW